MAEVEAYDRRTVRSAPLDFADDVAVPPPPRVLGEGAGLDPPLDRAVLPKPELAPAQVRDRSLDGDVLVGEGDPAEGAPRCACRGTRR